MKILHLVANLGSGGAEKQLYLLCRETRTVSEHIVDAVEEGGRWEQPLRTLGIEVRCLGRRLRHPTTWWSIRGEINAIRPDVIHAWLPSLNVLAGVAAAGTGIPVVAGVRNVDDWKGWLYRSLDRLLAPFWSVVVANSHAGADQTRRWLPGARVITVPNGIELAPLTCQAPRRSWSDDIAACSVCRLVPHKRVDRILELARSLPQVRFLIAGDGPMRAQLERGAPPNVRFLGHLDDVASLLAESDFFVLASEREGMSNSLVEAMQAGCVPIVTAVGDNPRIVEDGVSGRVVAWGEMAAAFRQAIPMRQAWSENARRRASCFTVETMARKTLTVYEQVRRRGAGFADPIPGLHQ